MNLIQATLRAIGVLPIGGLILSGIVNAATVSVVETLPIDLKRVELRIRSERNQRITKITEISPRHPAPQTVLPTPVPDKEVWYPVVDVQLRPGMEAVVRWSERAPKQVALNHHFYGELVAGATEMRWSGARLESWENNVYCEPASELREFFLSVVVPVVNGQLHYSLESLSDNWRGSVSWVEPSTGVEKPLNLILPLNRAQPEFQPVGELSRSAIKKSIVESLSYLLRSQNLNPASPTYGSLHLFYDLDAATYRSSYWIWGSGPAVTAFLRSQETIGVAEHFSNGRLQQAAERIGQSGLAQRIMDPSHPAYGIPLSRWRRAIELPFGFEQCAAPSDANFLSGWAWLPLYRKTGRPEYLEAAKLLAASTRKLMEQYELVPQDYYVDRKEWSMHTIDESAFGTEGLGALAQLTGASEDRQLVRDYMQQHVSKMERVDGFWERGWNRKTGVMPSIFMTRGLGWAMEGLLATHEALPTEGYADKARRLADQMLALQREDGSWCFIANGDPAAHGISEKGTALWASLLYRLHRATRDERYLRAARRALSWCMRNQYAGPDPLARGGLVGETEHSAVGAGHRAWYPVTCAYATSFAVLAALDELAVQDDSTNSR